MNSAKDIDGLHLMANLHGCVGSLSLDAAEWRAICLELVEQAGLVAVGDCFHQFGSGGVTGVVVLAESHLSIHTWPENQFVTLDVFVCNMNCDNRAKARQLFDALVLTFLPKSQHVYEVERS